MECSQQVHNIRKNNNNKNINSNDHNKENENGRRDSKHAEVTLKAINSMIKSKNKNDSSIKKSNTGSDIYNNINNNGRDKD